MSIIRYNGHKHIFVATRGHPLDRNALADMFESFAAYDYALVDQPAATAFYDPQAAAPFDVLVFYDMPGVDFTHQQDAPHSLAPTPQQQSGFEALLDQGKPMLFLHHAVAGWPGWDLYGEVIGAKFFYRPYDGALGTHPDSGYRHDVTHTMTPADDHPITQAMAPLTLQDELYLFTMFDDDKQILLTSDYDFTDANFYSANHAVHGRMNCQDGWAHQQGSNAIMWVKHYRNSPIVYLQCGDGAATFANKQFRALVKSAMDWLTQQTNAEITA